ncbi:MAG: ATP-dependent helicase [Bacteroidales bacterium]|nr:ATP-dependent helicase [Bacteroidales bacterium]
MNKLRDKIMNLLREEAEDQEVSFDDLIASLTLTSESPGGNMPAKQGNHGSLTFDQYEEVEVDEETEIKIRELRKITDAIPSRLLPEQEFKPQRKYRIDYAGELNPQQLAAVLAVMVPLLVIAGAGSGKTRVITYKVSWLIENGLHPSQILLLTFTRKAANEMLDRVEKLLGDKSISSNVMGGTFHGFSNTVLRQYSNLIGLTSNFSIIDDKDGEDIIDLLKNEMKLAKQKKERPFPRKELVQEIISKARNHELSIADTLVKYFDGYVSFLAELEILSRAYEAYKKASNLMDYDDLMSVLRDKLRDHEVFRNKLREKIKYVLVDEYQDTNNIQREIVELLCGGRSNLTVVGDDAQSIYSFRGANFENILRFPVSFPDCRIVKIEQNYRSGQGILDFANDVIGNARIGFKKKLFSTIPSYKKPVVIRFPDGIEEAQFITEKILEIRGNDLDFSDFAVLTRASWQSNYVQAELMKRQIPFVVVGGIKFSERRHVKDIMAFLKISQNPLDAVAWHRILQLNEGIGKVRASEIVTHLHALAGKINFGRFLGRKYFGELSLIETLYEDLSRDGLSPVGMLDIIYPYYIPRLKQIEDDYEVRIKDLETFRIIAAKYNDLQKFLADFTLEPPSNRYQEQNTPLVSVDEKPVVVSTIHSAKGLEWHSVFIPHALDGLLPSVRSMETIQELEEERRLFYVAASRAKENLFITMPSYIASWDAIFNRPSRFLAEVDKNKFLQP